MSLLNPIFSFIIQNCPVQFFISLKVLGLFFQMNEVYLIGLGKIEISFND